MISRNFAIKFRLTKAKISNSQNISFFPESMKVEGDDNLDAGDDDFYADNSHEEKNWEEALSSLNNISVYRGNDRPRKKKKKTNYSEAPALEWYHDNDNDYGGDLYSDDFTWQEPYIEVKKEKREKKKRGRPKKAEGAPVGM